jgi:cytochrome c553
MASKHSTWHIVAVKLSIALVSVVVLAAACDRGVATSDATKLYQSLCAACHGADGKPNAAMVARLNVRDLTSAELRARITPALVEAQIRKGSQNKLMPAFEGALTDAQIKALAEYVASPTFMH